MIIGKNITPRIHQNGWFLAKINLILSFILSSIILISSIDLGVFESSKVIQVRATEIRPSSNSPTLIMKSLPLMIDTTPVGYALRFPRFISIRDDKTWELTTNLQGSSFLT